MADKEKKRKLLKAKIAVALQDEYKRVPMTEEIDSVFHRIRVMYKAVLGCTTSGLSRKSPDSLPCFNTKTLMLIGYARVSTLDQTLALQQDALSAAGCEQIYTDTVSGSVTERPGLTQALSHLRAGDTLVVWCLDR